MWTIETSLKVYKRHTVFQKMQLVNLTQDIGELPVTKRRDTMPSFPIKHSTHGFINVADRFGFLTD